MNNIIKDIENKFDSVVNYERDYTDIEVLNLIEEIVLETSRNNFIEFEKKKEIVEYIFNKKRKYDFLEPYLNDEKIQEIMINGPDDIFIEKNGEVLRIRDVNISKERLNNIIQLIASNSNKSINKKSPIMDTRLINGERVCAVLENVAINGPVLSIRKFSKSLLTMDDLIKNNTISKKEADFLAKMVKEKKNIFISGGTSSGKTTLLGILSEFICANERIITIEDSLELNLSHVKNIIKMEVRKTSEKNLNDIDAKELLKTALRLRPDRIIVGEVRGREVFYMLQAMNTGHQGSMSTGHANSAYDMLNRLESMVLSEFDIPMSSIKRYIAGAVDIMVHVKRLKNGKRKIEEIYRLDGLSKGEYVLDEIF